MKRSIDYHRMRPLRIFFAYYRPHWKLFALDMGCAFLICLIDLAFPYLSREAMNVLLPQSLYQSFFVLMAIIFTAYIGKGLLYYVVSFWGHCFGVQVEADMRRDLFSHLESMSFSFYDRNRTGVLLSRVTNDLFEVTELAHHGPEDLFISSVTLIGAFTIMCTIEWRLALIVFSVVPLFIIFIIVQRQRMRRASLRSKEEVARVNSSIESGISGMRTAKAFHNEENEIGKFRRANESFVAAKKGYYRAMAVFQGGMEFCTSIMPVLVIAAGGYFIMQGTMDFSDLIAFTLYVATFLTPIKKLSSFVEQYMQGMAGFSRFLELMRTEPEIQDEPEAQSISRAAGEITFASVTFAYEGKEEVLRGLDLRIKAGEHFAIVGHSGGGKSTLCQLIPRFYDVSGGAILLDGQDIRALRQRDLRRQIGIVAQEVFLFADSILENIRYGRPDASDAEVIAAAKRAEIHEDVMQMEDGYGTYVGERGVLLSGGQKQRISIARVFLKDPPIVILDEATSALDSITEARIQRSFDELCRGRTSLVIAHRLSTVRGADRIAVIEQGVLVEEGSHEALLAKKGTYAALVAAQETQGS